jgi:hypothetical protein
VSVFNPRWKKLSLLMTEFCAILTFVSVFLTSDEDAVHTSPVKMVIYSIYSMLAADGVMYLVAIFFKFPNKKERRLYTLVTTGGQLSVLREWEAIEKRQKIFAIIGMSLCGIIWLYSFYYVEINEIHKRRFLHQNNSIEIFLKNGKNYYLSFNLGFRDKIVKAIILNIKQSHLSKNVAFFIKNNFDSIRDFQNNDNINYYLTKKPSNEEINDNLSNMTYEIQNESSMKNENMIFIMDNNLFWDMSKKYETKNFYKNIFKKNFKKSKYCLATITNANEIIEKSYDKWTNGHLDTYSYIMFLNTISGRTYSDIAQYPVFPWIIKDYTSKVLDLNNTKSYRDFLFPIYAQDEDTRTNLKNKYDCFEDDQKEKERRAKMEQSRKLTIEEELQKEEEKKATNALLDELTKDDSEENKDEKA